MPELTVTRPIAAALDRMWAAWTEPVPLTRWFWPPRFRTTAELDVRPGGRYRIAGPGGGIAVGGTYREVEPLDRLAFTWRWDSDPLETLVTVGLRQAGGGTEVSIAHAGFVAEADRQNHVAGWEGCLDRLERFIPTYPG